MRSFIYLSVFLFALAFNAFGQASPCAERDYNCRLAETMKALKANPKDPENYYEAGRMLQFIGGNSQAIEMYSMYVSIPGVKPEHVADGYGNRGMVYRQMKLYDKALADQTKAIELSPRNPRFYVNRGNVQVDLNKTDAAMADYDLAIKADPKYAQAYAQRGLLLTNLKRTDEGIRDLGRSIELDPNYIEPYYNRGTTYYQVGKCALAIPDFDKYIPLVADDPTYQADGLTNRGICHGILGNRQKGIDDLTRVIELEPARRNAYLARARIYRDMKKIDLAEADEKKAASLSKP